MPDYKVKFIVEAEGQNNFSHKFILTELQFKILLARILAFKKNDGTLSQIDEFNFITALLKTD